MQVPVAWAHEKLRIPQPGKDEVVLGTVTPPVDAPTAAARVAVLKATAETDVLDNLAESMAGDWHPIANMIEGPVQQLLASCKSLEEFNARLPELISLMDTTQLAEQISRGLFAAEVAGRTGAA